MLSASLSFMRRQIQNTPHLLAGAVPTLSSSQHSASGKERGRRGHQLPERAATAAVGREKEGKKETNGLPCRRQQQAQQFVEKKKLGRPMQLHDLKGNGQPNVSLQSLLRLFAVTPKIFPRAGPFAMRRITLRPCPTIKSWRWRSTGPCSMRVGSAVNRPRSIKHQEAAPRSGLLSLQLSFSLHLRAPDDERLLLLLALLRVQCRPSPSSRPGKPRDSATLPHTFPHPPTSSAGGRAQDRSDFDNAWLASAWTCVRSHTLVSLFRSPSTLLAARSRRLYAGAPASQAAQIKEGQAPTTPATSPIRRRACLCAVGFAPRRSLGKGRE